MSRSLCLGLFSAEIVPASIVESVYSAGLGQVINISKDGQQRETKCSVGEHFAAHGIVVAAD